MTYPSRYRVYHEKKGSEIVKDEKKKEIAEIVKNMQNMSRQSILIMKNAAEVLRIRDSMDKKAG